LLQRNFLALPAKEGQRHVEKQISPALNNDEKTKLPI
jgi:hypothetical protein